MMNHPVRSQHLSNRIVVVYAEFHEETRNVILDNVQCHSSGTRGSHQRTLKLLQRFACVAISPSSNECGIGPPMKFYVLIKVIKIFVQPNTLLANRFQVFLFGFLRRILTSATRLGLGLFPKPTQIPLMTKYLIT